MMDMNPILIISAMEDVELNYLEEILQEQVEEQVCGFKFIKGKLFGKNIVLCSANVGVINATMATTIAIERFKPIFIINQGCAGAIDKNIHKGDIVIGTKCINITSILTGIKQKGQGCDVSSWELINFIAGQEDRLVPQNASEHLIEKVKKFEKKITGFNINYGVIGSGDIWNREIDRMIMLNSKYDIICEDMESIGVYTVANKFGIPAIGIKIISDNAILNEEYERKISIECQKFVEKFVASV